ncbi:hypothetical protein ACFW15_30245, partial [Streptomyces sp. NPDC058953]
GGPAGAGRAAAPPPRAGVLPPTPPPGWGAPRAGGGPRRALTGAGHRTVLIDIDNSGRWNGPDAGEVLPGPGLSSPLLLAYQPALLVLDADGAMLSAEPVGSAEALAALTEEYTGGSGRPSTTSSLTTGVAS